MAFGIYVHIPYCLQRCRYCDFTTFEWGQTLPPAEYMAQVRKELFLRRDWIPERTVDTIYFGGGTPSLIDPALILSFLEDVANAGFSLSDNAEITIEINPATIDRQKLDLLQHGGVNRYSVGAQTFNDNLLKLCGRKHSAEDTRQTLRLLNEHGLNYSFDLLFALPTQTLDQLKSDLEEVAQFDPPHLSAYCLTVPEGHPMASHRPVDDEQLKMFAEIENNLAEMGILKYEISNFAKPGFESKHNWLYWTDQPYWGLGLSSHSYLPKLGNGFRFWNSKNMNQYLDQVCSIQSLKDWPSAQCEQLQLHELATDFCHIHLRTQLGLSKNALRQRFGAAASAIEARLTALLKTGWLIESPTHWRLTNEGQMVSNRVFSELTFLQPEELTVSPAVDLTFRQVKPYLAQ